MDAAHALVAEHGERDEAWVVDAMLPGFLFLLGRYPPARVERFRDDVARAFLPLRPLLVYLTGDRAVFLERAGLRSGPAFVDRLLAAVGRIALPEYSAGPIRTTDELRRFFGWADARTRAPQSVRVRIQRASFDARGAVAVRFQGPEELG